MYFSLLTALSIASLAVAQAPPPACATNCVNNTPSTCTNKTDVNCLCHDDDFITKATQCILTTCQGNDVQASEQFAQQLCAAVGVTLTSTPSVPSSTDGGSASAPATSGGATTTAPTNSASAPANSGSTSGSGTATTPSAPASTSSGAAAHATAGFTGLTGAFLAALLAL